MINAAIHAVPALPPTARVASQTGTAISAPASAVNSMRCARGGM